MTEEIAVITVWGRTNSNNVKKVLWCAVEANVPFERIDAGGAFGIVDTQAYREMNPNGLVPVIKDGELVLWESHAIVRYIAARYAPGTLWAQDPGPRALADRWMDWTNGAFIAPFVTVFRNIVRTPEADRNHTMLCVNPPSSAGRCSALWTASWSGGRICPANNSASATYRWGA